MLFNEHFVYKPTPKTLLESYLKTYHYPSQDNCSELSKQIEAVNWDADVPELLKALGEFIAGPSPQRWLSLTALMIVYQYRQE